MKLAIREYITQQGKNPFREWLKSLDTGVQARIQARHRIYFGKDEVAVILLLAGGDKASQSKDIAAAKRYWKDFREAKHGKTQ